METCLASGKGSEVWQKCGFSEGREVPRVSFSCGLILAWLPREGVQIVYDSPNLIHINVLDNKGYGHLDHAKRGEGWQQLRSLKQHSHPSWLFIRDFNQVLSKEEKLSFRIGNIIRVEEFQKVLSDVQLCNLTASG